MTSTDIHEQYNRAKTRIEEAIRDFEHDTGMLVFGNEIRISREGTYYGRVFSASFSMVPYRNPAKGAI